jgi:acyl-CoA reductase-like NAD-dependent aldehyde dehydrogenase
MNDSLDVKRTAKLYINGAFPRSESGRTFVVNDQNNKFLANVSKASRKDARDAVVAARSAFNKWSDASAYNRGQVIYRIAEILQGRSPQFIAELESAGV